MQWFVPTGAGAIMPMKPQSPGKVTHRAAVWTKKKLFFGLNMEGIISLQKGILSLTSRSSLVLQRDGSDRSYEATLSPLRNGGMEKPKMWFIMKEGENELEHPQPEAFGLGYTHINHQIFPASTRTIPKFLLLCSTTPAHHLPSHHHHGHLAAPLRNIYCQNSLFLSFGNSGLHQ